MLAIASIPNGLVITCMQALRALRAGRTVPADQAAPEYVRDKVAQTTAERAADKADKAARIEQATRLAHNAAPGEGRQ